MSDREIDCSTNTHPDARIIVDAEDYDWIASRRWTPADNGKGQLYFVSGKGRGKTVLHREIARARFYEDVDHVDGDTLNNRKRNLRTCTKQQNTWNQTAHAASNCAYKGVHRLSGARCRFKSYITKDGTTYNLGTFNAPEDAALAHDAAALHLHGQFAFLNFPDAGTTAKAPREPVKYGARRHVG